MKGLRLVLFDLDGTLTSIKTGAWEAVSEYAGLFLIFHCNCVRYVVYNILMNEQGAWTRSMC